ncbi:MAG TPA: hypothetical protein VGK02_06310 [Candidatus Aquicultor sp.]|jgi:hypothetical protein
MRFYSKNPSQCVWDKEKGAMLCKFENGIYRSEDERTIAILTSLGYDKRPVAPQPEFICPLCGLDCATPEKLARHLMKGCEAEGAPKEMYVKVAPTPNVADPNEERADEAKEPVVKEIDASGYINMSYKDLQDAAKARGINPFGMKTETIIEALKSFGKSQQ